MKQESHVLQGGEKVNKSQTPEEPLRSSGIGIHQCAHSENPSQFSLIIVIDRR
jgi:hypothetical protein